LHFCASSYRFGFFYSLLSASSCYLRLVVSTLLLASSCTQASGSSYRLYFWLRAAHRQAARRIDFTLGFELLLAARHATLVVCGAIPCTRVLSRRRSVRPNDCDRVVAHASTHTTLASGCTCTSSYRLWISGFWGLPSYGSHQFFLVFFSFDNHNNSNGNNINDNDNVIDGDNKQTTMATATIRHNSIQFNNSIDNSLVMTQAGSLSVHHNLT